MRCQHLNNIMKKDFTVCKLMWDAGVFNPDVFVNNHCDWFFSDVEEIKRLLHVYLKTFGVLFFLRCPSCSLLNLLFEDEDALPLLRGQHGDLFWGQLQDLHDQGGLEGQNKW